MSDEKKVLSPEQLFGKANRAASGIAFFETHHERLTSSDMPKAIQALALGVKDRSELPTPALAALKPLLVDHILALAAEKLLAKASKVRKVPAKGAKRVPVVLPYMASVFDSLGRLIHVKNSEGDLVPLTKNVASLSAAESYVSRNVCALPNSYGEIVFDGRPTTYDRDRCFAIAFPAKPMALHRSPKKESQLSWTGKASQSTVKFSRG